jgi:hypothetical protein
MRLLEICSNISISHVSGVCFFPNFESRPNQARLFHERLTSRKVLVHQRHAGAHQRRLFVFVFRGGFFTVDTCMS